MKKIESLVLKYLGYSDPVNKDEIEMECLGLATAIATAQQRISVLQQSLKLTSMISAAEEAQEESNEKIIETPDTAVK